jgi:hypothetical protein
MPWEELKKANIETVIEKLNEEKQKVRENGDGVNGEHGHFKAVERHDPWSLKNKHFKGPATPPLSVQVIMNNQKAFTICLTII